CGMARFYGFKLDPKFNETGISPEEGSIGVELGVENGDLYQLLRTQDYNLFSNSAMLESDFLQVTQSGAMVHIQNTPTYVTLGITSSVPCLPLPNLLLIARTKVICERSTAKAQSVHAMELKRLLPLRYVKLTIHNKGHRLLKLRTVSQKKYYLQLRQKYSDQVFQLWTRMVHILHSGLSITCKDPSINILYNLIHISDDECTSDSSTEDFWEDSSEELPSRKKKASLSSSLHLHFSPSTTAGDVHKADIYKSQVSFDRETGETSSTRAKDSEHGIHHKKSSCSCHDCEFCLSQKKVSVDPTPPVEKASIRAAVPETDDAGYEEDAGYGIWLRDTTSGMMPLSLLNSLVAVGQSVTAHNSWIGTE
ncbi:protein FAM71F1-like, partial [Microcaecilia unicolor]|uniref:Protein FAM71F1-like n=1 Tax=Microcaecilia unicolor TaxID=1415580 RepID=A0A6P7Z7I8_9AMPH